MNRPAAEEYGRALQWANWALQHSPHSAGTMGEWARVSCEKVGLPPPTLEVEQRLTIAITRMCMNGPMQVVPAHPEPGPRLQAPKQPKEIRVKATVRDIPKKKLRVLVTPPPRLLGQ